MPQLTKIEVDLMVDIFNDPTFDDANLHGERQEAARSLYNKKLINAVPIQDSDAGVEALSLTEYGSRVLDHRTGLETHRHYSSIYPLDITYSTEQQMVAKLRDAWCPECCGWGKDLATSDTPVQPECPACNDTGRKYQLRKPCVGTPWATPGEDSTVEWLHGPTQQDTSKTCVCGGPGPGLCDVSPAVAESRILERWNEWSGRKLAGRWTIVLLPDENGGYIGRGDTSIEAVLNAAMKLENVSS